MNHEFWKNKKVLVTGHTGFKGSWLSLVLKNLGAKVIGYSLKPVSNPNLFDTLKVKKIIDFSYFGDVRDVTKLKKIMTKHKPDITIHLAAQAFVGESYKNPLYTYDVNILGTLNLINESFLSKNVKACLVVTSDKCYENKEWSYPYREDDQLGGHDLYSSSKACAEILTRSFYKSFLSSDPKKKLFLATARAGNVIGGGDYSYDRLVPDYFRSLDQSKQLILRNPNSIRPWQHVLDALAGYLILCQKLYDADPFYEGAWNFGPYNQNELSVIELVSMLNNHFDNNVKIKKSKETFHEAKILKLDISKSLDYLNWKPILNLKESVEMICDFYKSDNKYDLIQKQISSYIAKER